MDLGRSRVCPVDNLTSAAMVDFPASGFRSVHSILSPVGHGVFVINKEKFKWHMV
jgi:hypothetical protein